MIQMKIVYKRKRYQRLSLKIASIPFSMFLKKKRIFSHEVGFLFLRIYIVSHMSKRSRMNPTSQCCHLVVSEFANMVPYCVTYSFTVPMKMNSEMIKSRAYQRRSNMRSEIMVPRMLSSGCFFLRERNTQRMSSPSRGMAKLNK